MKTNSNYFHNLILFLIIKSFFYELGCGNKKKKSDEVFIGGALIIHDNKSHGGFQYVNDNNTSKRNIVEKEINIDYVGYYQYVTIKRHRYF
jgi:hypothetical protein